MISARRRDRLEQLRDEISAAHGVEVVPMLPVSPWRRKLARIDLRNHRKLAVIDGRRNVEDVLLLRLLR